MNTGLSSLAAEGSANAPRPGLMQALRRQMTPRAALAVGVLVLLASVVSGREKPDSSDIVAPVERTATRAGSTETLVELELDRLKRQAKDETITNLFAPLEPPAPPRAAPRTARGPEPAAEPAKPEAPPLPFKYLGQVLEDGRQSVFLARENDLFTVQAGQTIDSQYKVDEIRKDEITLTYTPAGIRQSLAIPALE